jgi:carbamate kinase
MKADGHRGWRYVVPSPMPLHVCDISLVEGLICTRTVVIADGGGGIPVVRDERGCRQGVEAVIDKDLTAALMANILGIHDMIILTAGKRSANPSFAAAMKLRTSRLGNQRTARDEHGSTTCAAMHGAG